MISAHQILQNIMCASILLTGAHSDGAATVLKTASKFGAFGRPHRDDQHNNANSRIDKVCLQNFLRQTNSSRQSLSAFGANFPARASAFLIRFVKRKSRQTLSADLSADLSVILKAWGEGPRHCKVAAIMQTNFVCKCRQKMCS